MAILPIVKYPDPILREISKPVEDPAAMRTLAQSMAETMYASNGAGLAAIQVGELYRMFIIDAAINGGAEDDPPLVFINPELVELSEDKEIGDEGCLSFPGIYVPVQRSLTARIRATNLDGQVFDLSAEGLAARAFQHETDHLNARLLIDYVGRIKRQLIHRKMLRASIADEDDDE